MFRRQIYINEQLLDLYDDENIIINSSVQNINDISRVFNDFSETIIVPATPNNNRIFKHWYNFSIDNGFDARVRHKALIEIQTTTFKEGSFRLDSATTINNKPINYKLTFFGLLIELKEALGDDYLNTLDFTDYDFTYSSANVLTGLTTGFSSEDFVFPLLSTDKQYLYNSNVSDITEQERLSNIAWNGSGSVHGVTWTSLRPALKVIRIIELIESKYGITFSRDFIGNTSFNNLYLWLANQDTEKTLSNNVRATDFDNVSVFQLDKGSFNNTTGAYSVTDRGSGFMRAMEVRVVSSDSKEFTVQVMNNSNVVSEKSGSGNVNIDVSFPGGVDKGSQLYVRFVATAGKIIDSINFRVKELSDDTVCFVDRTTDILISTVTAFTSNFIPSIKVIDFLSSLFKLNNLTIIPTSPIDFKVQQLDDWYNEGFTYDITPYINTGEESPIDRPKIYKEIKFLHEDPRTILASQFKKINNTSYGDLETKLKDASGNTLDGEEFEINVDFEQMVYEKLIDINSGDETNIVYGLSLNDSLSDELPNAHILYIRKESVSSNNIGFINDTGGKEQVSSNVFMPSHANSSSKEYSTVFGSEIDEHDGGLIQNSYFQLYYRDYITDSFSEKRRKINKKARLPLSILHNLKLNDKLIIGTDRFIINTQEINLTTQEIDFELLNDIYSTNNEIAPIIVEEETTEDPSTNDPPPIVSTAKSFDISSSSSSTGLGSCILTVNTKKYWGGNESTPTLGDVVYNNINKTSVFSGNNNYYKVNNNRSVRINSSGVVMDLFICTAGNGGGNA
ncbi:hypothetical protein [Flagellimonas sp. CMM7]|uniref:hypothetical protein n=1 Tax=Flagellimonas sp. CMM7 TaxID=2654676 RepID=UPI0013D4D4C6|nr:hypothetical protein [Flagellimonas sp. CMM7]UII80006.1 hypothetical protein LV704_00445 [Flagellimonas sp. CMM7]